ncbi:MAG: Nif3-like dinuclear metal center hexameric protein [Phycisphaerales bacterium]
MLVADLIAAIDALAPPALAEPWDNVGLLVGDPERDLEGPALLTIDLTPAVLAEALAMSAGAIVAYHPPLFSSIKRITSDSRGGRTLLRCIEAGMVIHSPHTALDAVAGGVTDWLADGLGAIGDRRALVAATPSTPGQTHKFVTFVPRDAVDRVRMALSSAGAGRIGEYDQCAFEVEGTGSFQGSERSNPAVGKAGRLERVEEVRLEMVCAGRAVPLLVETLRAFHPYEEPAFDVYELAGRPDRSVGAGRRITLDQPRSAEQIAASVRDYLGLQSVRLAVAPSAEEETISRVGVCPGSGAELVDAAIAEGCQLFVTGEMKHHDLLSTLARGCSVILAGHTNTERGYLPKFAENLRKGVPAADIRVSEADRPVWRPV